MKFAFKEPVENPCNATVLPPFLNPENINVEPPGIYRWIQTPSVIITS